MKIGLTNKKIKLKWKMKNKRKRVKARKLIVTSRKADYLNIIRRTSRVERIFIS